MGIRFVLLPNNRLAAGQQCPRFDVDDDRNRFGSIQRNHSHATIVEPKRILFRVHDLGGSTSVLRSIVFRK